MFQVLEENTCLNCNLKPSGLQEEELLAGQIPLFTGQYSLYGQRGCSLVQLNTVIVSSHPEKLHNVMFDYGSLSALKYLYHAT